MSTMQPISQPARATCAFTYIQGGVNVFNLQPHPTSIQWWRTVGMFGFRSGICRYAASNANDNEAPCPPNSTTMVNESRREDNTNSQGTNSAPATTRRDMLRSAVLGAMYIANCSPSLAIAGILPKSKSELLEEVAGNKMKDPEEIQREKEMRAEEKKKRLEKQREIEAELKANKNKKEVDIDANLRANYYFPTARKRYLPRVKVAHDAMSAMRKALEDKQYDTAMSIYQGPLKNAAGPMRLYASSLAGQGLSLSVSYVSEMNKQAELYEKLLSDLEQNVKSKNSRAALGTLTKVNGALQAYRTAAKIDKEDGGIGDFPTDRRLGSGFVNNSPTLLKKNVRNVERELEVQ